MAMMYEQNKGQSTILVYEHNGITEEIDLTPGNNMFRKLVKAYYFKEELNEEMLNESVTSIKKELAQGDLNRRQLEILTNQLMMETTRIASVWDIPGKSVERNYSLEDSVAKSYLNQLQDSYKTKKNLKERSFVQTHNDILGQIKHDEPEQTSLSIFAMGLVDEIAVLARKSADLWFNDDKYEEDRKLLDFCNDMNKKLNNE